jgi:hypothetical protein
MINFSKVSVAAFAAVIAAFLNTAPAQVIVSNSLVTYTYEQGAGNAFVPSSPLTSATAPDSLLSFFPSGFATTNSGSAWDIKTVSSVLTVSMDANNGLWFGPNALQLSAQVNYSLVAPTSTSSAGLSVSAPLTLYITEVDGVAFGSPTLQLADSLTFVPSFVETTGPGSFPSSSLSGEINLSLNTIKAHFGIGAGNNITGMRVQISPVLSVWSERGSSTASLVNLDVANAVVPEPSTYALLVLGAGALGVAAWRRRKA